MRNTVLTVGQSVLREKLSLSGSANDNTQFNDGDMLLRALINGAGGIKELIDSNTKKEDGVSSWNGQKLPADVNMLLERIRVAYGQSPLAGGTLEPARVRYSTKYSDFPVELANANLEISQHGNVILSIPIQRALSEVASDRPAGSVDGYELGAFRHLAPNTDIDIAIRFPKGVAMNGDVNHFIELHLIGAQTGRKAA